MAWWIWLLIGVGLGIIELTSVTFVLLWFAVAAVVTAALTYVLHPLWAQLLVYGVISTGFYLATRPLVHKWRGTKNYSNHLQTRLGQTGTVVSGAQPGGFATVRIEGELWSATCRTPLQAGQSIVVEAADGAVLHVILAPEVEEAKHL